MNWVDAIVDVIIKKNKIDSKITISCGVGVSGVVHIGKAMDAIVAGLVYDELIRRGFNCEYILIVDDYDVCNKSIQSFGCQKENFIGLPYARISFNSIETNYAKYNMENFKEELKKLGFSPKIIYRYDEYRDRKVDDIIFKVIKNYKSLNKIFINFLTDVNPEKEYLIETFCPICGKLNEKVKISHNCVKGLCKHCKKQNLIDTENIKLKWKLDWCARWHQYKIDFEPCNNNQKTKNGSYDVACAFAKHLFNMDPPVTCTYGVCQDENGEKLSIRNNKIITISYLLKFFNKDVILNYISERNLIREWKIDVKNDFIPVYEKYYSKTHFISNGNNLPIKRIVDFSKYFDYDTNKICKYFNIKKSQNIVDFISSICEYDALIGSQKETKKNQISAKEIVYVKNLKDLLRFNKCEMEIIDFIKNEITLNSTTKDYYEFFNKILFGTDKCPRLSKYISLCRNKVYAILSELEKSYDKNVNSN